MSKSNPLHILVLAAGQGKRMVSSTPKVLHPVLFQSLLHHVLDLSKELSPATLSVVIGHGAEQVRSACKNQTNLKFLIQDQPKGTGHAVMTAKNALSSLGGRVLVLCADVVLLKKHSLQTLLDLQNKSLSAATVLTAQLNSPKGYGRILRDKSGQFTAIREEADCSEAERATQEVNAGVYCFDNSLLWEALAQLDSKNKQGEFYLTDVIEIFHTKGKTVNTHCLTDASEMWGVNDRADLVKVETELRRRINAEWMQKGVTFEDPLHTWIDAKTQLGKDVFIESGVRIVNSQLADGVRVEAGSRIVNSKIGVNTLVKQGCYIEGSTLGTECQVGPYAHLRPQSELDSHVKIGNFVEIKKSKLGEGSKASHLSYIGDATIGKDVNLGCGFITCNYDGSPEKKKTVIEDGAFIGSDSQMVAPVTIGRGAYVASGSTITKDVPSEALGIARTKQENKLGVARRLKIKK